ncbi:MAG: hypothetical protein Fur0032_16310 [Terrimicrobiaceae bacterium]
MKTPEPPEPAPSIEAALERIEVLVSEMESGDLPLESVIAKFEEGARLVKACQARLTEAEKRIQVVLRDAGGSPADLGDFGEVAG